MNIKQFLKDINICTIKTTDNQTLIVSVLNEQAAIFIKDAPQDAVRFKTASTNQTILDYVLSRLEVNLEPEKQARVLTWILERAA